MLDSSDWRPIVEACEWLYLAYFLALSACYLALNLISFFKLKTYMADKALDSLPRIHTGLEPPISILAPAYNEQTTIVASVKSMLQLSYPLFEVIVVNDGSRDATLSVLTETFALESFPEAYRVSLKTGTVNTMYRSKSYPNLRVIDKENGGKADALNAAINAARYPLFCSIDADSVIQRESLQRISLPFMEDQRVVAVGGSVRVANGCLVTGGFLRKIGLPPNCLAGLQVIEYLRAFLFGRLGWSAIGGLLIISGAFGLFRKQTVIEIGGYSTRTVGEDMELVVRMHRILRGKHQAYRMVFLPDPVSWTEVPESLRTLKHQRMRWQRGLCESLSANLGLLFSRNGGTPGWLAFPFMLLFECLGPMIEVAGYCLMLVFYGLDYLSGPDLLIFLFAATGLGILLSLSSLMLEEKSFHLYDQPKQILALVLLAVLENLGYRQLCAWWRFLGICQWLFADNRAWGEMKRNGNWQQP